MTTFIILTRNGKTLGKCDAKCYNATTAACNCICKGANHGKGEAHANHTAQQLAKTLGREYMHPGDRIHLHRTSLQLCLFPRDTERSSDSTPQEILDPSPSSLPEPREQSGS